MPSLETNLKEAKAKLADARAKLAANKAYPKLRAREKKLDDTMRDLDKKRKERELAIAGQFYDTTVTSWSGDDEITGPFYHYDDTNPATNIFPDVIKAVEASPLYKTYTIEDIVEKMVEAAKAGDAKLKRLVDARQKVYTLWCRTRDQLYGTGFTDGLESEVRNWEYEVKDIQKRIDDTKAYQTRKAAMEKAEKKRRQESADASALVKQVLGSRTK